MAVLGRLLVFVATAYIAIAAILWTFQTSFLYPAPQDAAPLTPGYEEVALETEDGLTLRAFYHEADAGLPTLVYFHGNGGNLSGASVSNGALVEAGILGEDDRVELLDGRSIAMSPIGTAHLHCVNRLLDLLVRRL